MSEFCFLFVLLCSLIEKAIEKTTSLTALCWLAGLDVNWFFFSHWIEISVETAFCSAAIIHLWKKILIKKSGSIKCRYYGDIYMYFLTIFGLVLSFSCSFSNNCKKNPRTKTTVENARNISCLIFFWGSS